MVGFVLAAVDAKGYVADAATVTTADTTNTAVSVQVAVTSIVNACVAAATAKEVHVIDTADATVTAAIAAV